MQVSELYYAVLCAEATPSTSMAHEESWRGPYIDYVTAERIVKEMVGGDNTPYVSGHVCKRFTRAEA